MSPSSKAVRVRKNVLTLGHPGDDLDWYAKGVAVMKSRPIKDPTSWRYLAAVHGYPGHADDPFAQPGESLPSTSQQRRFWNQCQHQTWYFLSWHRGYVALFEEIVAAAVVQAGGPKGWALPYWNYSDGSAQARKLPDAFLHPQDGAGHANALWVQERTMTAAPDQLPASHVNLTALLSAPFEGSAFGGDPGFGGPQTGFSHFGGVNGRVENVPHNQVHVDVGGLMSDPNTAALDPIFWVHHANIDRLWEVWRHRDASFTDPTQSRWLTGETFELHDAKGKLVSFTSSQMRDSRKVRHGYEYDDIKDPFKSPVARPMAAAARVMARGAPQPPHLVAATDDGLALSGTTSALRVRFNQPARHAAMARVIERPVRAFLNLENVTGMTVAASYDVFLAVPGDNAAPLLAGHLNTFGVRKASDPKDKHGGSGITTVIDISPLIDQLHRERHWDGEHLDVSFVPSGPKVDQRSASTSALQIGRISVYYA